MTISAPAIRREAAGESWSVIVGFTGLYAVFAAITLFGAVPVVLTLLGLFLLASAFSGVVAESGERMGVAE